MTWKFWSSYSFIWFSY